MHLTDTHSMDNGEPALPAKDIKEVLDNEIKWVSSVLRTSYAHGTNLFREWHFRRFIPTILDFYSFDDRSLEDIYFLTQDPKARQAALNLRDAVLHLRKEGAFVAVPLYRVNYEPMGPHPAGQTVNGQSEVPADVLGLSNLQGRMRYGAPLNPLLPSSPIWPLTGET